MEPFNLMGYELIEKIKNKEIKIEDLIQSYFDRIEKTDPFLHAFVRLSKVKAIKKAKKLDANLNNGKRAGKLFGLPIAIEEGICVKDDFATCCSKILEDYIPPFNATVVEKAVEQENAICTGRTNMDEFGLGNSTETSCYGTTRNPWNKAYVPGGSSGGAGACIASGQSIFSLGSDTGGSLRGTSSYCGVVGLRPTFGRVSRFGLASYAHSLEQIGILTKCVKDCALLLETISGHDPLESTTSNTIVDNYIEYLENPIKNKTIGVPKEINGDNVDLKVKEEFEKSTNMLTELGAKIIEFSIPNFEYALHSFILISLCETSSNLAKYDGLRYGKMNSDLTGDVFEVYGRTRGEKFSDETKRRVILGTYFLTEKYYEMFFIKALKIRALIKSEFQNAFKNCTAIVCPTMPTTAFKIGELTEKPIDMYRMDIFTCLPSLAGLPAMSIPCGFDNKNLPIGFQIIGNFFNEKEILNVGYSLEQELKIFHKLPTKIKGID